jgi:hypothetical protein
MALAIACLPMKAASVDLMRVIRHSYFLQRC